MQKIAVPHGGTMRFWGDWFGRPMDNYHKVVKAVYNEESNILVMTFDNEEECTVYSPVGISSTKKSFYIEDADVVVWLWYYYGKERTKENRFQIQYTKENEDTVICQNDYTQSSININSKGFYAVEIC